jgi:hypothetical protein
MSQIARLSQPVLPKLMKKKQGRAEEALPLPDF